MNNDKQTESVARRQHDKRAERIRKLENTKVKAGPVAWSWRSEQGGVNDRCC